MKIFQEDLSHHSISRTSLPSEIISAEAFLSPSENDVRGLKTEEKEASAEENKTSAMSAKLTTQRSAIDAVNWGLAKNRAQIKELSEAIAQQEKRSSSLEKDVKAQGNVIDAVNGDMSKNRADIEELYESMVKQENKTNKIRADVSFMDAYDDTERCHRALNLRFEKQAPSLVRHFAYA